MPAAESISLDLIIFDAETQPRVAIVPEKVDEYKADYEAGRTFPPVDLYFDGSHYWIGDGYHRVLMFRAAGESEVPALVHPGGKREAILHAVGANADHGMRRTNADKRRAVEIMLRDEEWSQWSNVAIAEQCKVSESLVRTIRNETQPTSFETKSLPRKGRDGRTINTASIGRRPESKPAPSIAVSSQGLHVGQNAPPAPEPANDSESPDSSPEPAPQAEPEPTGQSRVNGELVPDPPEIAEMRAAGAIPADAIPEIDEPEETDDAIEPFEAPPETSEDDLSDEDWLASLPLSGKLSGVPLRTFQRDALLYRRLAKARASYKHTFARERGALDRDRDYARVRGPYEGKSSWWLQGEHPRHWHICPPTDKGGCDGTGQIPPVSKCPLCRQSGYLVH